MYDSYALLWSLFAVFAAGVVSAILYKRWGLNAWSNKSLLSRSHESESCSSENESSSSTSDSMVESEDVAEASVRRQQLGNILQLMNTYKNEFGLTTMDDLLEQAKLYGIKK